MENVARSFRDPPQLRGREPHAPVISRLCTSASAFAVLSQQRIPPQLRGPSINFGGFTKTFLPQQRQGNELSPQIAISEVSRADIPVSLDPALANEFPSVVPVREGEDVLKHIRPVGDEVPLSVPPSVRALQASHCCNRRTARDVDDLGGACRMERRIVIPNQSPMSNVSVTNVEDVIAMAKN